MAHYAFLDQNNVVTNVITGRNEGEMGLTGEDWEAHYASIQNNRCVRTSYNTRGGVHKTGGTPFRKNYAGRGYVYDELRDAFIPPQPYASWVLNENTCLWEAPVPKPNDTENFVWDEDQTTWQAVNEESTEEPTT